METDAAPADRFAWSLWGLAIVAPGVWLPGHILPAVIVAVALVECTHS